MKRIISLFVAVIIGVGLVAVYAGPASAANEPITIKVAVFLPYYPGDRHDVLVDWCKRVTERSKGRLDVKFVGGSQVIPMFGQFKAVKSGVIDVTWIAASFYQRQIPEVVSLSTSELTPAEERANGFHDYLKELHMKLGLVYLGRIPGDGGMYWISKKRIKNPRTDFKGLKFGVTGMFWHGICKKLGIVPVMLPAAEKYTALERGVIQGNGVSGTGTCGMALGEVCKYFIDHGFLAGSGSVTIMNLNTWNKLSKDLQDLVVEEYINLENSLPAFWEKQIKKERDCLKKQGMEFIKLSPEDAEWFVNTCNETKWEEVKKAAPDSYAKLRKFLKK